MAVYSYIIYTNVSLSVQIFPLVASSTTGGAPIAGVFYDRGRSDSPRVSEDDCVAMKGDITGSRRDISEAWAPLADTLDACASTSFLGQQSFVEIFFNQMSLKQKKPYI